MPVKSTNVLLIMKTNGELITVQKTIHKSNVLVHLKPLKTVL